MAKAFKNYADFNTVTVTGRIFSAEIPQGRDFLAVTVITNLETEGGQMTVTFNNSNGLMSLFQKGFLPVGRVVTVTGHINSATELYQNKQGDLMTLKYPRIHLTGAQILDGGLGPSPEASRNAPRKLAAKVVRRAPVVDATPSIDVETPMEDLYEVPDEVSNASMEEATPPTLTVEEAQEELVAF